MSSHGIAARAQSAADRAVNNTNAGGNAGSTGVSRDTDQSNGGGQNAGSGQSEKATGGK